MRVQEFLSSRQVPFKARSHERAYDAQHLAHAIHCPGDNVAKGVVVKADGQYLLTVLQATHGIDMDKLKQVLGAQTVGLASEEELQQLFPDCEVGAIPPFGSQYGLRTLLDQPLTRDGRIAFEGNTHTEAFEMRTTDYRAIESPQVASFSRHI